MTFPIWLQKLLKLLNIRFCNCDCDECFDCEHYWMDLDLQIEELKEAVK